MLAAGHINMVYSDRCDTTERGGGRERVRGERGGEE